MSVIERLIDMNMKCVYCDAPMGECDCHQECLCGWIFKKNGSCNNPIHDTEEVEV